MEEPRMWTCGSRPSASATTTGCGHVYELPPKPKHRRGQRVNHTRTTTCPECGHKDALHSSPVDAYVKKWEPVLGKLDDLGRPKAMIAAMLEQEAKHLEDLKKGGGGKIGSFEKFAFPLIRRAFPKLIGDEDEPPRSTPLQDLAEQTFAEHHPSDPDWEEWKQSVKDRVGDLVVRNEKRDLDEEAEELPPELKAELDNIHLFEPPPSSGGPLVSVQPMTQPVGGLAFYRPKYAESWEPVEPGEPEEAAEE